MLNHLLSSIKLFSRKGRKFYCLIFDITGFYPKKAHYYQLALQHKSLMTKDDSGWPINNERLEYLGDAILSAVIAHELFTRFPLKDEGTLTKMRSQIVNRTSLNRLSFEIGLNQLIRTQPLNDLSQTHIPGDALEALIGAIYLDRGYQAATKFIIDRIINRYPDIEFLAKHDTNYKSLLIEWGQKNRCDVHFVTEEYPNQPSREIAFIAHAFINNTIMGEGKGSSKKEAQQNAASIALQKVSLIPLDKLQKNLMA